MQNASSIIRCRERWPQAYYFTEGSIVIVWRRSHLRQLLSCELLTTTTMTTRHASSAYLDKWELLVRDKLLGSYKRHPKFGSRKQKKCKGEEASIARAHQTQAHTSTGLNHLCILSFLNNPSTQSINSTQLSSSNSLTHSTLIA